ncbi:MAG: class I SAM-dependent methyltransferase [Verrucomicrobiae bacterium]|nr:class I SAM-dependent methyltransferase [Verrucomicrobiae bacterium]
MDERDWYDTPHYYDIIFGEDTATEATFLEVMHHRHGLGKSGKPGAVLEPACGSGRLMHELARRGWRVAGFDRSEAMLNYADARLAGDGLDGTAPLLWRDGMEDFRVPRGRKFDLAHCLVSTFKYLLTEAEALACLQRVAAALRPGGVFVLGLHLTDYQNPAITHERWVGERDGLRVTCNTRTWPVDQRRRRERLRTRLRIETVAAADGELREQETHWEFRTYSASQVRTLIRKVPELTVVACHDFHHDPDEVREFDDSYSDLVVVLRRR